MAFVFRSEREDIQKDSNPTLGPGTYLGQVEHSPEAGSAPFLCKFKQKLFGILFTLLKLPIT